MGAFRTCLPPMGEPRLIVLRDLMVVVALRCGYDARTRFVALGLDDFSFRSFGLAWVGAVVVGRGSVWLVRFCFG